MKDPVKQFEELDGRINNLFEAWFNPKSWFQNKPKYGSKVKIDFTGKTASGEQRRQAVEDGTECEPGESNRRFGSELGSAAAKFYPNGKVKDINPFLINANISKRFLRCYDLQKDKMKIAWLFDGNFDADVLDWDPKKKKVIFQGKWNGGLFNGINYARPSQAPETEKRNYKFFVVSKRGVESGPYTANQIVKAVNKGKLTIDSVIRPENFADNQYIKDNKTLSFMLKIPPTTPIKKKKPKKPGKLKSHLSLIRP